MANRIPLVVVSTEQLIKELPAVDDLDLANSSIRNVATANVGNINTTNLVVTTANLTTANITTIVGTSALTISTGAGSNGNIIFSSNNTEDLRITPDGNVGIGTSTPSSKLHIVGTTILEEVIEKANITATAMGANANVDILDCAVVYYTANSTANTTLNIRGNTSVTLNSIMSVNQSMTLAFVITNGASAYRVANVQLDAVNTAIKWSGGSAPTACSNSTEAYSFTVIKTGAAAQYTLLGSKTQFA
jgi:hypothetical protein